MDKTKAFSCRWFSSTHIFLVCLLIGLAIYTYQNIYSAWRHYHTNDFKHMYLGAKMIRYGLDPYDPHLFLEYARYEGFERINPFVYPSFSGIFFLPLSFFSFDYAAQIWFVLNHLFIGLSLLLLLRHFFPSGFIKWGAFFITAAAVSHPLFRTLTAGQLNAFLLLLYTLILLSWQKERGHWLAFLIAAGGMIKMLPFFMGILLLERKNWKYLVDFAIWMVVLNIFAIAVTGWETHLEYLNVLAGMEFGSSAWYEFGARFHIDPANQSLAAFLLRNFTDGTGVPDALLSLPLPVVQWSFYGIAAILIGFCFRKLLVLSHHSQRSRLTFFSLVMMVNFLIPPIVWDHYFIILLPVVAIQAYLLTDQDRRYFSIPSFILFLLPAVAVLLFPFFFVPFHGDFYFFSFLFLGCITAYLLSISVAPAKRLFMIAILLTWLGWFLRFPYYERVFQEGWLSLMASNKFYVLVFNILLFNFILMFKSFKISSS